MTATAIALRTRLDQFDFDEAVPFPFSARLARENAWSADYTRRVIEEYRRFLYLSQVVEPMVTPSEAVDQAWHLHLCYTRSYWTELCGKVLEKPLHHVPTSGWNKDALRFQSAYRATLASYRLHFHEEPPVDIWPRPEDRWGGQKRHRWVNAADFWLIPRGLPKAAAKSAGIALGLALMIAGALVILSGVFGSTWRPGVLDWHGPAFLSFYVVALAGAWVMSRVLAEPWSLFQKPDREPSVIAADDLAAVAVLSGGDERFRHAMAAAGIAERKATTATFARPAARRWKTNLEETHHRLAEQGLRMRPSGWLVRLFWASLPFVVLVGLGLTKVAIGQSRGKPVAFLGLMLLATLVLAVLQGRRVSWLTPAGAAALTSWREAFRRRSKAELAADAALFAPLGVAAFGIPWTMLNGFPEVHKELRKYYPTPAPHAGGCSGGGDGGGGCGGGGCGGGGCGGCGS